MTSTRGGFALAAALAATVLAGSASAQDDGSCSWAGRRYASGYAVCQSGMVQTCIGGEWQGNGSFCVGSPDDQALGVPVMGAVDDANARAARMRLQNAPLPDDE